MSEDTTRIICGRVEHLFLLPGNRIASCVVCGESVTLSIEGEEFRARLTRARKPVELVCGPCALKAEGDSKVVGAVPGAVARMRRLGLPNSPRVQRAEQDGLTLREVLGDDE